MFSSGNHDTLEPPYQKNIIQIIHNTKIVYILYSYIQRLYKSKFRRIINVQNMYIKFLHIYKKRKSCTKLVQSSDLR